jgi:acyl-CoA hydrolase
MVLLSRNDVDMAVTEYGIANPDFREEILRQAVDFGLLFKKS